MVRVRVAHSGKQHAYRHALSLEQLGALDLFVTSGYYKPDQMPDRLAGGMRKLDAALRRRFQEGLPAEKVIRRWRYELPELLARRILGPGRLAESCVFRRDQVFDGWVAREWVRECDVYWGFQGSCLESLKAARQRGIIAVAEFATAHVNLATDLLSREAERHPEWASTISNFRFPKWYQQRLEQEPHEADYCIAASEFTRSSLEQAEIASDRILTLPLGTDLRQFSFVERSPHGSFRILFVGGIGQRKGVKYLLQAFDRIRGPGVELTLAGPVPADMRPLAAYKDTVRMTGRLDQAEIVREMQNAHVLVLPSVFEGFGLVIVEAMATGLPVIASTHSAGPDVIREGRDGYVLEPDDVDGLAARLESLRGQGPRDRNGIGGRGAVARFLLEGPRRQACRNSAVAVGFASSFYGESSHE